MGKFLVVVVVTLGVFYLGVYQSTLTTYERVNKNIEEQRARLELAKEHIKELPMVVATLQEQKATVAADRPRCLPFKFEAVKADLKSLARPFPHVDMGMSPEVFLIPLEEPPVPEDDTPQALQGFGSQGAHLRLTGPRAEVIGFLTAVLKSEHNYVIKTGKLTPDGAKLTGEIFLGPIPPPK